MKIEITNTDIMLGKPGSDCHCAIAIAMKRKFPGRYISVWGKSVEVGSERYKLPQVARDFINLHDIHADPIQRVRACKPFTFELAEPFITTLPAIICQDCREYVDEIHRTRKDGLQQCYDCFMAEEGPQA